MNIKYGATVQLKGNRVTEAHEFSSKKKRDSFVASVEKLSIVHFNVKIPQKADFTP